jgi:endoglycosylceramidase
VKRRAVLVLALLALAPSALAGLVSVQVAIRGSALPASKTARGSALSWLHVEHPQGGRPYIADEAGRYRILRGTVAAGLIDFFSGPDRTNRRPPPFHPIEPAAYTRSCPANSALIRVPPLCEQDFREMRHLGFDVVKLGLSWSLLEPAPGRYDKTYLDRIAQVVGWARDNGIYVILDMHQNSWSRYIGDDSRSAQFGFAEAPSLSDHSGAPSWAVLPDGLPSVRFAGKRELNPAVQAAMTNFWFDRDLPGVPRGDAPGSAIQDHYVGALAALARRFKDESTVAGYNIFNEPQQGFLPGGMFEDAFLMPFYRRVLDALTGADDGLPCPASAGWSVCGYPDLGIRDRRHIYFLDANVFRAMTDLPTHLALPLSTYPNLVYGFHAYTHVYTLDRALGAPPGRSWYPLSYDQSFDWADRGARLTGAALMVSEFGDDPSDDDLILRQELAAAERHLTSTTFWTWKENCGFGQTWGVYSGVYGEARNQRCSYDRSAPDPGPKPPDGGLRAGRMRLLDRASPRAVAGTLLSYSYDPQTGSFSMRAHASEPSRPGDGATETVVYLPPASTAAPQLGGRAVMDRVEPTPGGGRLAYVAPTGGDYSVAA